ncbi:MAG: diguanylate cyclase [Candidatus Omnitrophota bacterium]|nr:diguanylate cyclase [Candidatus Omnitrophota bacterium]
MCSSEHEQKNEELKRYREHLENLVRDRTQELQENEKRFRLAFENALDAIMWADPETGIIINCNKAAEKLFERSKDGIIGQHQTTLHPADEAGRYKDMFFGQAFNKMGVDEADIVTKSGKIKTVLISCSITEIENKEVVQGVFHDITQRKEMENACRISEESYHSIFESANDAIIIRDIKTYKIIDANERACELFCYRREEMAGLDLQAVIPGESPHMLKNVWDSYDKAGRGQPQLFEQLVKDKVGRTFWVEVSLRRAIIGGKYQLLAITRDITERKESENKIMELNSALSKANENLKHLALKDSHTGLYNHHYLVDAMKSELERAKRHSQELSVIMMDIDYFKSINDVYGHQFGDTILKQFARLLKKEVRVYDIVIRFGGEEFIIISPGTGKYEALTLAQRILDMIRLHGFGDKKHSVKIKASAAVSSYPIDKRIDCGIDFIDIADQILNKAKEDGGDRVYSYVDLEIKKDITQPQEEPGVDVLKNKIKKLTARGNQSVIEAIFAFAKTIELKDRYTGEHVEKTIHYATGIAHSLGLPKDKIEVIKEASVLHDLGKIGVPEKILLKAGKLTKQEREIIKEHPQIGADIVRPIHSLRDIIPVILHHHEWWNGKGYPHSLRKESIPIGARIVAIADVYQALISDRPYRKALPKKEAVKIIKSGAGTQFDPKIVDAFLGVLKKER